VKTVVSVYALYRFYVTFALGSHLLKNRMVYV